MHESAGLSARSERVGDAVCDGILYDLGEYPALVDGDGEVKGELYVVSDALLVELDGYEGYRPTDDDTSLYVRERRDVRITDDEVEDETEAWVYIYNRDLPDDAEPVASGDWNDAVETEEVESGG